MGRRLEHHQEARRASVSRLHLRRHILCPLWVLRETQAGSGFFQENICAVNCKVAITDWFNHQLKEENIFLGRKRRKTKRKKSLKDRNGGQKHIPKSKKRPWSSGRRSQEW